MGQAETIDEEVTQSDLVHARLRESPLTRWVLLDGNRSVLSGILAFVVFLACAAIGLAGYIPVEEPGTVTTMVGSIVGGTLPFITIVLAINQLVLSQELGWTGDLAERFDEMVDFRRDVETVTETPISPASPAAFLDLLVETAVEYADALEQAARRTDGSALSARLEALREAVEEEGATVSGSLEGANFGTFDALSAVLGHFNGAHRYAARTILVRHGETLTDDERERLEMLVEVLDQLAVARQTFKTLYVQYELAHLSKLLLYVGFPALLGGGLFTMSYGPIVAAVEDPTTLVFVVGAAVTLVFLPFVVLLVYTFRIASIASRTADFGPFVPRVDFGEASREE